MTIENDKYDSVSLLTQFSFFLFRLKFAHLLSNSVNELNENLSVTIWTNFLTKKTIGDSTYGNEQVNHHALLINCSTINCHSFLRELNAKARRARRTATTKGIFNRIAVDFDGEDGRCDAVLDIAIKRESNRENRCRESRPMRTLFRSSGREKRARLITESPFSLALAACIRVRATTTV